MSGMSFALKQRLQAVAGASVAAFGVASYYTTTQEEQKVRNLFRERTTIKQLQLKANRGEALPELAIICGTLHADASIKGSNTTAIGQILLTRLSPSAVWKDVGKPDKDGVVEKELVRTPKKKRYTVATMRMLAPGLHIKGLDDCEATLKLPPLEEDMGDLSPALFLTEADAQKEFFTSQLHKTAVEVDVGAMTGSRFQHLSKFISLDRDSEHDNPRDFLETFTNLYKEWTSNGNTVCVPVPMQAGFMSGMKFLWLPEGFYDDPSKHAFMFPKKEFVTAEEFVRRGHVAAGENNMHSPFQFEALDLGRKRDEEFGYRLVHLDIPLEQPVTIVAKPVASIVGEQRMIELVPPTGNEQSLHSRFRILKDHTIDDLLLHPSTRSENKGIYQGLSAVGAFLTGLAMAGFVILP